KRCPYLPNVNGRVRHHRCVLRAYAFWYCNIHRPVSSVLHLLWCIFFLPVCNIAVCPVHRICVDVPFLFCLNVSICPTTSYSLHIVVHDMPNDVLGRKSVPSSFR